MSFLLTYFRQHDVLLFNRFRESAHDGLALLTLDLMYDFAVFSIPCFADYEGAVRRDKNLAFGRWSRWECELPCCLIESLESSGRQTILRLFLA